MREWRANLWLLGLGKGDDSRGLGGLLIGNHAKVKTALKVQLTSTMFSLLS